MPAFLVPLAIAGGTALANYFANRHKQSDTQTTNSAPTLDPQFQGLQNIILPNIQRRLANPSPLPAGYVENNTQAINDTFDNAQANLDNQLTARGLSRSPAATRPLSILASKRAGAISTMKSQVPLVERQLQEQDLQDALAVLGLGRGQSSTTVSTGAQPGGLASGASSAAQMLGYLYGIGAFGKGGMSNLNV